MEQELLNIIALHEKMRHSYFWSPPSVAAARRAYEEKHTRYHSFEYDGMNVFVEQKTNCSAKRIYYKMKIYINNELTNKDIRFIKIMLENVKQEGGMCA